MNSGLYAALSGAVAATERLDTIASNLANANTAGFKRDRITFESILDTAAAVAPGDDPRFVSSRHGIDFTQGALRQTGNRWDLAIEGDGFFSIQTPQGVAYTRQGSFRLDAAGRVVSPDGYPLLANGAPLTIPPGATTVVIDPQGGVSVDGAQRGRLDIVDFTKPYPLQKEGGGLFRPTGGGRPRPAQGARVSQGYLEETNITPVGEMVQMIDTNRHYEACTRVIRSFDDITGKAVNDLGKL
ncbi:MAG: flagellar basal-body rod protein FlgF [Desulfuromonadia bacterium]